MWLYGNGCAFRDRPGSADNPVAGNPAPIDKLRDPRPLAFTVDIVDRVVIDHRIMGGCPARGLPGSRSSPFWDGLVRVCRRRR